MKLPDLTEEQAAALLAKKTSFAESQGKGDDVCANLKCRCAECTCGAGCTCNISPEVNCDECKDFKTKMIGKTNAARVEIAEAFYAEKVAPKFEGISLIRGEELKKILKEGSPKVCLVDVRSEAERVVSTILNAVAAEEFEADPEGLGAGKLVVTFCTIGGRSCGFAKKLLEMPSQPWAEVRNYELSLIDWCHVGGELVDLKGEPTTRVHAGSEACVGMFPVAGYEVVPPAGP